MTKRRGRGEGSIETLPSGKFRVVISCGLAPNGQRQKLTHTFKTKKEATAWRDERLSERRRGVVAFAGGLLLTDWLDKWLAEKQTTKEAHTAAFYGRLVGLLKRSIPVGLQLARLTMLDVQSIYSQLARDGLSADAIRKAACTLSTALNTAVSPHGLIPRNPARGATL